MRFRITPGALFFWGKYVLSLLESVTLPADPNGSKPYK